MHCIILDCAKTCAIKNEVGLLKIGFADEHPVHFETSGSSQRQLNSAFSNNQRQLFLLNLKFLELSKW